MHKILTKLGITSRVQLAAVLDLEGGETRPTPHLRRAGRTF
jgi:hypothetical protein